VDSLPAFSPASDVAVRTVEQGAVLVDMRRGHCFELNRVGYEVWLLIQEGNGKSEADICRALSERYQKSSEAIATDVRQLLRALTEHKLVRPVTSPR
jgi:hypothetical protein